MGTLVLNAVIRGISVLPLRVFGRSAFVLLTILTFLVSSQALLWAHRSDHPGVLLLYYRQKEEPYAQEIKVEVVKVLNERVPANYDLYEDSVAGWGDTDKELDGALLNVLKQRYSRANIHLLIPVGNTAFDFARIHGRELFPEASIVYVTELFGDKPDFPAIPNATGVILQFDPEPTLRLALQQTPGARRAVVVTGQTDMERMELLVARNAFEPYEGHISFQYVTDVTFDELLSRLSTLPSDSVLILLNFGRDSAGDTFVPTQVLASLSRVATRPIYVIYDVAVGAGALGGQVHDLRLVGREMGILAAKVLNGMSASDVPVVKGTFQRPMFDWRQMKRWGIDKSLLPTGSLIVNRKLTVWDKYRWWILGALAIVFTQAVLISFLLLARFRASRAEQHLSKQVELEELISELAVSFINIPSRVLGEQIEHSCSRLLSFFQVDRIAVYEFSATKDLVRLLYSYRDEGIDPFPLELKTQEWSWIMPRTLARTLSLFSRFEDIPQGATEEREYMKRRGIRSMAVVPIHLEQDVSGILMLTAVNREVQWTEAGAQRLQTISYIFANALSRKRTEEALRCSEDLRRRILDSLVARVALIDETGIIRVINKSWGEFWAANGAPRDFNGSIGLNYLDVCRRSAEAGCEGAERALNGILSVITGKLERFEMEYDCSSPDQQGWYSMTVVPLLNGSGAVIRHLDITVAHQALSLVKESEHRFRVVADSAPVMIWMAGPDRMCNYFNTFWLYFRGRTLEQEVGDSHRCGIHPSDMARCLAVYNEAFDARSPFTIEYRLRRADGEYRWVLERGVPRTLPQGEFAGFIAAAIDITEHKESEQARAQLSGLLITAQERERASIARELHDHINQRLALLAIELQQFQGAVDGLSQEQEEKLAHFWDLVNEISHDVQALSHKLHSSQLQHLGLVAAIRGLCHEFSKTNGVEAKFRCTGTMPAIDESTSLALFRVAQEALRNTFKYSRAQLVEARLDCAQDAVTLQITDDGIGFDTMAVKGRGLGLISMQERIRLVGGEFTIRSTPGAGTQVEARISLVHDSTERSIRVERRKRKRA